MARAETTEVPEDVLDRSQRIGQRLRRQDAAIRQGRESTTVKTRWRDRYWLEFLSVTGDRRSQSEHGREAFDNGPPA